MRPAVGRRRLLQVGSLGALGLSVGRILGAEAAGGAPAGGKVRSCILIFYYGGPSHLDTWDPKPDAPAEVRGEFGAIETSVPGVRLSEHLPRTARVLRHAALVRSVHHPMRNHNSAAAETLTGRTPPGGDLELLQDDTRSFPCLGSTLSYGLRRHQPGSTAPPVSHVALPHVMHNVVVLPGQRAGFLGPAWDPMQVESNPASAAFRVPDLDLAAGSGLERLEHREALLRRIDGRRRAGEAALSRAGTDALYERAFRLLYSEPVRESFDLQRESTATRDRYGRHTHGQSVLLARRLVEAGVRFVSVYDGVHNGQDANWDSHQKVFARHRDHLLPPADQALSALIEDLHQRGLLDETLVLAMGEFGRTPKINADGGRDHWPDCYTMLLAGGGVRGGTVYGASDAHGAYPAADPVTPGDLAATLLWRFGVDPAGEMRDRTGRPFPLAEGQPLRGLF